MIITGAFALKDSLGLLLEGSKQCRWCSEGSALGFTWLCLFPIDNSFDHIWHTWEHGNAIKDRVLHENSWFTPCECSILWKMALLKCTELSCSTRKDSYSTDKRVMLCKKSWAKRAQSFVVLLQVTSSIKACCLCFTYELDSTMYTTQVSCIMATKALLREAITSSPLYILLWSPVMQCKQSDTTLV